MSLSSSSAAPPPSEKMAGAAATASQSATSPSPLSAFRQTLMTQEECFVYKVPPLVAASGYRANDWNLAVPLETCGFQVERRDNDLYLLFTLDHHTRLFALSKVEGGGIGVGEPQRSIEPVVDSSRYFVTKIQNQQTGKEAMLGFGFRDREVAIDLLGNLQQFRRSIQREMDARNRKVTEIPQLKEGDKIHISLPAGMAGPKRRRGGQHHNQEHPPPSSSSPSSLPTPGTSGGPFLLKKPPPPSSAAGVATATGIMSTTTATPAQIRLVNMSEMEHPPQAMDIEGDGSDGHNDEENSEEAVAKSIIDDFGLEDSLGGDDDDDEEGGQHSDKMDDDNVKMGNADDIEEEEDDDFGDFQGA